MATGALISLLGLPLYRWQLLPKEALSLILLLLLWEIILLLYSRRKLLCWCEPALSHVEVCSAGVIELLCRCSSHGHLVSNDLLLVIDSFI